MNDQPEPTDDQYARFDRSHLANLYPAAKTFEQRVADKELADRQRRDRLPKNIAWTIAWRLYGILVAIFASIHIGAGLFALAGPLGAVPLSFSVGLLIVCYIYWVVTSTVRDFHRLGYRAGPLLICYVLIYPLVLYGLMQLIDTSSRRLELVVSASAAHVILVYVLMRLIGARS